MANEKRLTEKQKRFCEEYLVDLNATQAAIRAGYAQRTAYSQGQRLLKNVEIQSRISELRERQSKRTEITADRVIEELAAIAFTDRSELASINDKGYVAVNPTNKWSKEAKKAVSSIKESQNGIEVKSYDKLRALELLGKHFGIFESKQNSDTEEIEDDGFIDALNGTAADDWSDDDDE